MLVLFSIKLVKVRSTLIRGRREYRGNDGVGEVNQYGRHDNGVIKWGVRTTR
jgi:hypothetical protein